MTWFSRFAPKSAPDNCPSIRPASIAAKMLGPSIRFVNGQGRGALRQPPESDAEPVLTPPYPARDLPAETAVRSTITQIYEGTNQIQRMVMARQLLKG